jgi:hypothetical protein
MPPNQGYSLNTIIYYTDIVLEFLYLKEAFNMNYTVVITMLFELSNTIDSCYIICFVVQQH